MARSLLKNEMLPLIISYNRVTQSILLAPFSLAETKQFLEALQFKLSLQQILDIYMVIGGIPFYLNQLKTHKSIVQNINDLCFSTDGLLFSEFPRLFKSLFDAYDLNLQIIKVIAKNRYGILFSDLAKKVGKKIGGRFSERLHELEIAGFIEKLIPYGKKNRDHYYRINDEYTMFYLNWIDTIHGKIPSSDNYWLKLSKSAAWKSWAGHAFEIVCHKNVNKIIAALDLTKVGCLIGSWKMIPAPNSKEQGAQIDLLLDRDDNAITLCEIKYATQPFVVDKDYAKNLANKISVFQSKTKTTKQIFLAIISSHGLKRNIWSEDLVTQVVELNDLF